MIIETLEWIKEQISHTYLAKRWVLFSYICLSFVAGERGEEGKEKEGKKKKGKKRVAWKKIVEIGWFIWRRNLEGVSGLPRWT